MEQFERVINEIADRTFAGSDDVTKEDAIQELNDLIQLARSARLERNIRDQPK